MPMIKAYYTKPGNQLSAKLEIAAMLSQTTAAILHKDPAVTAVLVDEVEPANWIVGGASIADQQVGTFYVEVSITEHTNTKDETSEWVQRVYDEMEALLGPVHEASYVLVHAVDGDAYGYGGKTQTLRWARKQH